MQYTVLDISITAKFFFAMYMQTKVLNYKPVYIGDTVTATGTVIEKLEEKNMVKVETKVTNHKGELIMIGEGMEYIFREKK